MLEQTEIVHRIETSFAWIDRLASEATNASKLIDHLNQALLTKAFLGELVPQDPRDEPASVLLERIKARAGSERGCPEREAAEKEPTTENSARSLAEIRWEAKSKATQDLAWMCRLEHRAYLS